MPSNAAARALPPALPRALPRALSPARLPVLSLDAVLPAPPTGALRFGPFAITETATFPPPPGPRCWVYVTLNAEIALSFDSSPALRHLLQDRRALVSVDGQWIWWALRRKYPQRPVAKLSGSDLIYTLAAHCAANGRRLLLLGSTARSNAAAVYRLRQRWPALEVAGFAPAHYACGGSGERAAWQASEQAIEAWRADYVVLGLGAAKEHRFAEHVAERLDGRLRGLCCFGGAIDMAAGHVRRAPPRLQRWGLEWLYRLIVQPSRLRRTLGLLRLVPKLASGEY